MENESSFNHRLMKLRTQHADLEGQIEDMSSKPLYDQLAVQRLKRLKVKTREQINQLQESLLPDIIA